MLLKFTYLYLTLTFATALLASRGIAEIPNGYYLAALLSISAVFQLTFNNKNKIYRNKIVKNLDLIPIFCVLLWTYGVIIGLHYDNNPEYIFRNFSGLLLYPTYYALVAFKPRYQTITKIILFGGAASVFLTMVFGLLQKLAGMNFVDSALLNTVLFNKLVISGDAGVNTRLLYVGQLMMFTTFCFSLITLFRNNSSLTTPKRMYHAAVLVLVPGLILVIINSKAFLLALALYLVLAISHLLGGKHKTLFLLAVISALLFATATVPNLGLLFSDKYSFIFGTAEGGNLERSISITAMISELNFIGNGLGAEFRHYLRSEVAPYTAEAVYLNIVHKFGGASAILFCIYGYTAYLTNKAVSKFPKHPGVFALFGLLSFLVYSIGNPLLLSGLAITMHITVLYSLRCIYSNTD